MPRIEIGTLIANIGKQEYPIPENLNLEYHKYIVLIDKRTQELLAYSTINQN